MGATTGGRQARPRSRRGEVVPARRVHPMSRRAPVQGLSGARAGGSAHPQYKGGRAAAGTAVRPEQR